MITFLEIAWLFGMHLPPCSSCSSLSPLSVVVVFVVLALLALFVVLVFVFVVSVHIFILRRQRREKGAAGFLVKSGSRCFALLRAGRLGDRSFAVVALGSSMKIGSHRSGRCWAHDARCSAQSSAWWAAACKATCLVCLGARHARPGAPWVAVAAMMRSLKCSSEALRLCIHVLPRDHS